MNRFEKAKQVMIDECTQIFEKIYNRTKFPAELKIKMSTFSKETGEIVEGETSFIIPRTINYKTPGRLSGRIRNFQVSVTNDGEGHFRVMIDRKEYPSLPMDLVENQLGIPVQKKQTGSQSGYSSEPLGRAVWRYLTDRYNILDRAVRYEPNTM
jgi:hypothetical protein